jgi:hypothetical protein
VLHRCSRSAIGIRRLYTALPEHEGRQCDCSQPPMPRQAPWLCGMRMTASPASSTTTCNEACAPAVHSVAQQLPDAPAVHQLLGRPTLMTCRLPVIGDTTVPTTPCVTDAVLSMHRVRRSAGEREPPQHQQRCVAFRTPPCDVTGDAGQHALRGAPTRRTHPLHQTDH